MPIPLKAEHRERVPATVIVPADGRFTLTQDDKGLVADVVDFVQDFVAELPVQIAMTDFKSEESASVSGLAVRAVGNGHRMYAGSFDLLLRVRGMRSPTWRPYNGKEVAFDMKITGASSGVGVDSKMIREILAHGRAVLEASQKDSNSRLGKCALVAYLFRRPPGLTFLGRAHGGCWGFLLFDMSVFLRWDPTSKKAPRRLLESGTFIKGGAMDVMDVPVAAGPALVANPRPRRDRWADLSAVAVRPGWVMALDFVKVFQLGVGNPRHAASRAVKRLRDESCRVEDHSTGGRGPPQKLVKIADLRRHYNM